MKIKSIRVSSLIVTALCPTLAMAQPVDVRRGEWQRRDYCAITSPEYTGTCRYTVTTGDLRTGLNVHFDLDENGDKGLSFVATPETKSKDGSLYLITTKAVPRFPALTIHIKPGSCSLRAEQFICVTSDGLYQAHAKGFQPH